MIRIVLFKTYSSGFARIERDNRNHAYSSISKASANRISNFVYNNRQKFNIEPFLIGIGWIAKEKKNND